MEALVASAIGLLTAVGIYLILRMRTFPLVLGITFLSYGVNIFLFTAGKLSVNTPPIITGAEAYADPLPQALVLTAIVISFGMTAVIVMMSLGAYLESGTDRVDLADDIAHEGATSETRSGPDAGGAA